MGVAFTLVALTCSAIISGQALLLLFRRDAPPTMTEVRSLIMFHVGIVFGVLASFSAMLLFGGR